MTHTKKLFLAVIGLTSSIAQAAESAPVPTPESAPAVPAKNAPAPASLPGRSGMLMGLSLSAEFPHPANLAFEIRPWDDFSASASFGFLPTISVTPSGASGPVSGKISSPNAHFRWHPWSGAFFLGGILGYQSVSGSTTQNVPITSPITANVPTTASLTMTSMYFTPHFGWAWGMNTSGMFGGVELGAQIPMSPNSKLDVNINDPQYAAYIAQVQATPQYQQQVADAQNAIDTIGRMALPYFALRLGYMF